MINQLSEEYRNKTEIRAYKTTPKRNCYNCGATSHLSPSCPSRKRGAKCYYCNQYGHISTSCHALDTRKQQKAEPKLEITNEHDEWRKSMTIQGIIETTVRLKPENSSRCFNWTLNATKNILALPSDKRKSRTTSFSFDHVFEPEVQNEEIFNTILPTLGLTMQGKNICILAYGASGTGKSHTMFGTKEKPGIIPRSIRYIFTEGQKTIDNFSVQCSIYEIYNETFIDLLQKNGKPSKYSRNFTKAQVRTINECLQLCKIAQRRRKIACTKRNEESSRSHAIIEITLTGLRKGSGKKFKTNVALLDCAGTENANDHMENDLKGIRIREMSNINKSFSELARVFKCSAKENGFIDFRSSKLTSMLKPFLTGEAKTVIIATASQKEAHFTASKSTFETIDSITKRNEVAFDKMSDKTIKFRKEFKAIGVKNQSCHNLKNSKMQNYDDLLSELQNLRKETAENREKIEFLQKKCCALEEMQSTSDDDDTNQSTFCSKHSDKKTIDNRGNICENQRPASQANTTIGLKFDDVIGAFKTFKGDYRTNIFSWVTDFERQSDEFGFSDVQKLILAKRLLKDNAKLFLEFESHLMENTETRANFRIQYQSELIANSSEIARAKEKEKRIDNKLFLRNVIDC